MTMQITRCTPTFVILFWAIGTGLLCRTTQAGKEAPPDLWATARPFHRSFDFGKWATPFIDVDNPPVLELSTIVWDGAALSASAFYHNRDSAEPKQVEGRQIYDETLLGTFFWPYVQLEASNLRDKEWTVIGVSPSATAGIDASVLMYPDKAAYVERSAPQSAICQINLDPFRPLIGKFRYGRVVLRSGGASQFIVLSDLLPPEPSPTPRTTPTTGKTKGASPKSTP